MDVLSFLKRESFLGKFGIADTWEPGNASGVENRQTLGTREPCSKAGSHG
jgi:hypothetical protein